MAEERVIKIGMLGLGTVGTGVYKVLKSQQEEMLPKLGARVELKKILVRNVEKAAAKVDDPSIITTNFEDIANDPEIEIVVEVMGGKQPAMNYILACLDAGKNVVTANKDLVVSPGISDFLMLLSSFSSSTLCLLFYEKLLLHQPVLLILLFPSQ